ncbi:MAG: AMP-dependent synthetase/ligase [Rectinemataceae bacterium]
MKRTVLRMLDEAAERWASRPYALRKTDDGYLAYSFTEIREGARRFAAWMLGQGFRAGDNLAILAEGGPEWIIAECGMLYARCVSVPLSIKLLVEEVSFRLDHSGAKAVIVSKNQLKKALAALKRNADSDLRILYIDDDPDWARATANLAGIEAARVTGLAEALSAGRAALRNTDLPIAAALDRTASSAEEDDLVTICYTSGTTGNPKGIMLTHLNYWTNCHDGVELFGLPQDLTTLVVLPVDHSFAHTVGLYAALLIGMALYFVDSRGGGIATLRNIPLNLLESQPSLLMTVPALSGNFMKKIVSGIESRGAALRILFGIGLSAGIAWNGDGFHKPATATRLRSALPYAIARLILFRKIRSMVFGSRIRFCVGGGALLELRQQAFFASIGVPIYQGYGLTEAAPIISSNTPGRHKFGTSGIMAPSVECRIRKPDGKLAAVGENGEIVIRGDNVMKGYYRNPEATRETIKDGWLHTGDIGYKDEDGFLVVVGREKALLIAEDGEKYSPEEIEEAILSSTEVLDQVIAWCDQRKYVAALVTLDTSNVRRLAALKNCRTASELLAALKEEFFAFASDSKVHKIQSAWIPKVFQILPFGFSEKDGTINSTMKVVRHRIAELHRERLEYSYTPEGSTTINQRNLQTLRDIFDIP